ncbi:MAG: hypothetical protein ACFCVD_20095 [Nodosilinea sp.]
MTVSIGPVSLVQPGGPGAEARPKAWLAAGAITHWPRFSLALGLALGLALTGCSDGSSTLSEANTTTSEANTTTTNQRVAGSLGRDRLVSKVLPVQLRLRRGWRPAPAGVLHSSADLQAYNLGEDIYLVVVGESSDVVAQGELDSQATTYIQMLKAGFDQVISPESLTEVTQVGDFPAVQYQLQGEVLGKPVAYLHTTVRMNENYYQVVVWTPADLAAANTEEMKAIVQGISPNRG